MKKIKLLSIILCLMLVVSGSSISSFAATTNQLEVGYFDLNTMHVSTQNVPRTQNAIDASAKIVEALENFEADVDISEFNISVSDVLALYVDIVYSNPHLFYVFTAIKYSYWPQTNTIVSLMFGDSYILTEEEALQYQDELSKFATDFLEVATTLENDVEKALYANDYIVLNTEYDIESVNTGVTNRASHTMLGVFAHNSAVCQGYTLAYTFLLDLVGINSTYVDSDPMNHVWNLVEIDGQWYHTDVTWNDPLIDTLGKTSHSYFLVSESKISQTHKGFVTQQVADDTTYDNYYWIHIRSNIAPKDGYHYYFTNNKILIKSDLSTGETTQIPYTTDAWRTAPGETTFHSGNYARLVMYKGRIYYNTSTDIYSMNVDGSDNKIVFSPSDLGSELIYGLALINGSIYYEKTTAPSVDGTVVKTNIIESLQDETAIKGDVNDDGDLSAQDVLYILRYLSQSATLNESQFISANVNVDETVDISDVLHLQKILAQIIAA